MQNRNRKLAWVYYQALSYVVSLVLLGFGFHLLTHNEINIQHYRIVINLGNYHYIFGIFFLLAGVVAIYYTANNKYKG